MLFLLLVGTVAAWSPGYRDQGLELVHLLGQGVHGQVWEALLDGQPVAVKLPTPTQIHQSSQQLYSEYATYTALPDSPYLATYLGNLSVALHDGSHVTGILMELCSGTVEGLVHGSTLTLLRVWRDVVYGLRTLHSNGWVYRDMRPDNILICGGNTKISDFTSVHRQDDQELMGTSSYGSPHSSIPPAKLPTYESVDYFGIGMAIVQKYFTEEQYDEFWEYTVRVRRSSLARKSMGIVEEINALPVTEPHFEYVRRVLLTTLSYSVNPDLVLDQFDKAISKYEQVY